MILKPCSGLKRFKNFPGESERKLKTYSFYSIAKLRGSVFFYQEDKRDSGEKGIGKALKQGRIQEF